MGIIKWYFVLYLPFIVYALTEDVSAKQEAKSNVVETGKSHKRIKRCKFVCDHIFYTLTIAT